MQLYRNPVFRAGTALRQITSIKSIASNHQYQITSIRPPASNHQYETTASDRQ